MSVIDQYLKKFSVEQRETLQHLRSTILSLVPHANETLSYGMPAFKVGGKVVAGFDGFKKHCSYFPHSGSVLEEIDGFPAWCEVSKGTLKFPIGRKLPKSLVRKMISVRQRQIAEELKKKQKKSNCAVVRGEVDIDFYVQRDEVWKSLGLSAPARRALVDAKLTKLSQLSTKKRDFISGLHGMGPNAMKKLENAMKKANVKFK